MTVVNSCEGTEEHIHVSPLDTHLAIHPPTTVPQKADRIGCKPIDIVGSQLFTEGF